MHSQRPREPSSTSTDGNHVGVVEVVLVLVLVLVRAGSVTPASCRVDHSLHTRARPSTTTPNPANRRPDRNRERFPFLFPVFSPLARCRAARAGSSTSSRVAVSLVSRCARGPAARVDRRVPSREIHPIRSTAPHHHHHAHAPHAHAPLALRLLLRLAQRVSLHPIPTPRATRDFARACVRARVVGGLATARLAVSHRRERDEKRGAMRRALRCVAVFLRFGWVWIGVGGGGWGQRRRACRLAYLPVFIFQLLLSRLESRLFPSTCLPARFPGCHLHHRPHCIRCPAQTSGWVHRIIKVWLSQSRSKVSSKL